MSSAQQTDSFNVNLRMGDAKDPSNEDRSDPPTVATSAL
jgi:hypothetical protein